MPPKPVRILITGSRDWSNEFLIHNTLTSFHWMYAGDDITLVSGACRAGADPICERVAGELGWKVERHPADWSRWLNQAGYVRNTKMVNLGADLCVAFILDGSKGASMTADLAEKAGIETLRFKRYTDGLSTGKPDETGPVESGDPDILRAVETVERSRRLPEKSGHNR